MEVTCAPEYYEPSLNDTQTYVDVIPSCAVFRQAGLRCKCNSRDHVFLTRTAFNTHIRTAGHKKWLAQLNLDKNNHYTENEELKKTVASQKVIIAKLEKENNTKTRMIMYLTQQLVDETESRTSAAAFPFAGASAPAMSICD